MAKILIVEDEPQIVRGLGLYLERAGYTTAAVYDGAQAVPAFRQEKPDLILLDLNLPNRDGIDICRAVRRDSAVPIIMLTARSDEMDRLIGLELGADDYIVKPFSPREVVARVRAVLRRVGGGLGETDIVRAGALLIDTAAFRAWLAESPLSLTQSEFEILLALARHPSRVLSRTQLLEETQGIAYEGYERSIDQHIKNLRHKIRQAGGTSKIIETVYGVGYRLEAPLDPAAGGENHVS
ncbi:MAG: response regulator transcription factor [Candidatus Promineifilaceae bacterium]|nr:response regulator transcription factor [Candidatus Promineifilaceae bacterium]